MRNGRRTKDENEERRRTKNEETNGEMDGEMRVAWRGVALLPRDGQCWLQKSRAGPDRTGLESETRPLLPPSAVLPLRPAVLCTSGPTFLFLLRLGGTGYETRDQVGRRGGCGEISAVRVRLCAPC